MPPTMPSVANPTALMPTISALPASGSFPLCHTPSSPSSLTPQSPTTHALNRLDIENAFLQQQNSILHRELSQARHSVQALRKIVTQQDQLVQQVSTELRKATQKIRTLEAELNKGNNTKPVVVVDDGVDGMGDDEATVPSFDDVSVSMDDEDRDATQQQQRMMQAQVQAMAIEEQLRQQQLAQQQRWSQYQSSGNTLMLLDPVTTQVMPSGEEMVEHGAGGSEAVLRGAGGFILGGRVTRWRQGDEDDDDDDDNDSEDLEDYDREDDLEEEDEEEEEEEEESDENNMDAVLETEATDSNPPLTMNSITLLPNKPLRRHTIASTTTTTTTVITTTTFTEPTPTVDSNMDQVVPSISDRSLSIARRHTIPVRLSPPSLPNSNPIPSPPTTPNPPIASQTPHTNSPKSLRRRPAMDDLTGRNTPPNLRQNARLSPLHDQTPPPSPLPDRSIPTSPSPDESLRQNGSAKGGDDDAAGEAKGVEGLTGETRTKSLKPRLLLGRMMKGLVRSGVGRMPGVETRHGI